MPLAMQLIFTPMILNLMERKRWRHLTLNDRERADRELSVLTTPGAVNVDGKR